MHLAIHDAVNAIDRRSRPYVLDVQAGAGALNRNEYTADFNEVKSLGGDELTSARTATITQHPEFENAVCRRSQQGPPELAERAKVDPTCFRPISATIQPFPPTPRAEC